MRIKTNVSLGVEGKIVPPPSVLELSDAEAKILVERGFAEETTEAITWPEAEKSEGSNGSDEGKKAIQDMTVAELKALATDLGIDTTALTTKAKLLEAIQAKLDEQAKAADANAGGNSAGNEPGA